VLKLSKMHANGNVRDITMKNAEAGTFEIEYRDGFRAFVLMLNGWVHEQEGDSFLFAAQRKGQDKPDVCQFYVQSPDPFGHFAELTKAIDSLINPGHAPYPVERTLLTTGILDAVMRSRHEKGKRIETPHLEITYKPTEWGPAKGPIPKLQKK